MKEVLFIVLMFFSKVDGVKVFYEGEKCFSEGRYELALRSYKRALKELPEFKNEILLRMAECNYNLRKLDEAEKILHNLKKDVMSTYLEPEVLLLIAYLKTIQNKFDEASSILLSIQNNPNYRKDPRVSFLLGYIDFKTQKYDEAIEKLKKSENHLSGVLLARIYSIKGDPIKSLVYYKNLSREFYGTDEDYIIAFGLIETLINSGDFPGAVQEAKKFLDRSPKSHPLRKIMEFYLGVAYYHLREYTKALEIFSELVKDRNFPYHAYASYYAGNIKLNLKEFNEAVNYYQIARSKADDAYLSTLCFIRLIEAYIKMKNFDQAYLAAQQMKSYFVLGGQLGIGEYIEGSIAYESGNYERAFHYYKQIYEAIPTSDFLLPSLALSLISKHKLMDWDYVLTLGNAQISDVEKINDKYWEFWFKLALADANYYHGHYNVAEALYRDILGEANHKDLIIPANLGLGWCYIHQNRLEEGIALLEANAQLALQANDTNSLISSYYGLGVALFNKGEYLEAYQTFSSLVNTFPNNPIVPNLIYYQGLCALALKSYGDAIHSWDLVWSRYPNHPYAIKAALKASEIYSKAIKFEEANNRLNWIISKSPASPEGKLAQYYLGQNYYFMKNYERSISELEKFIIMSPEHELVSRAQELIQQAYYFLCQENPQKLEEFIQKYPNSKLAIDAEFNYAVDLYESNDLLNSAYAFIKFANNHPQDEKASRALLIAGQLLFQLKKYDEAIIPLTKFTNYYAASPQVDTAIYFLAMCYYRNQDYKNSIKTFELLLRNYKQSPLVTIVIPFLAHSYEVEGDLKNAVNYYNMAAENYEKLGDIEKAIEFYEYALNLSPDPQVRERLKNKLGNLRKSKGG